MMRRGRIIRDIELLCSLLGGVLLLVGCIAMTLYWERPVCQSLKTACENKLGGCEEMLHKKESKMNCGLFKSKLESCEFDLGKTREDFVVFQNIHPYIAAGGK